MMNAHPQPLNSLYPQSLDSNKRQNELPQKLPSLLGTNPSPQHHQRQQPSQMNSEYTPAQRLPSGPQQGIPPAQLPPQQQQQQPSHIQTQQVQQVQQHPVQHQQIASHQRQHPQIQPPPQEHEQPQPQQHQQQHQQPIQQNTVFSTTLKRGPWSPDEDRKLLESINIFGPSNWVRISQALGSRTPKQCRERYHQNLKPSLNRNPITPEEGHLIEELVLKYGKRWAEIARHLNGRSDNAIKNWWNGGANRRRRASTHSVLESGNQQQQLQQQSQQSQQSNTKPPPNVQPSQHRPSFNTTMFQEPIHGSTQLGSFGSPTVLPLQQSPPHQQPPQFSNKYPNVPPHQQLPPPNPSRSSSINQDLFQQQPGVKRLLEEQHFPERRHSVQTVLTSTLGSSSPFSRGGSSRNSSISFSGDFSHSILSANSTSNSRRSSLAHELFPNTNKRHNSQSNTYLSPNLSTHRGSISVPSGLTPLSQSHQVQSQEINSPIFKSDFTFNKPQDSSIKLPPPSSIYANPNFNLGNPPSSQLKEEQTRTPEEKKLDVDINPEAGEDGEPKQVMNISNLLS